MERKSMIWAFNFVLWFFEHLPGKYFSSFAFTEQCKVHLCGSSPWGCTNIRQSTNVHFEDTCMR